MSQQAFSSATPLGPAQDDWRRAGQQTAYTAADQGQEVASTAADQGREVASTAAEQGRHVASAAADRGQDVARLATQDVRQLAGAVRDEAAEVTDEVWSQARHLVRETSEQLQDQAENQTQQLASAIRRLGEQGYALAEGRPQQAPAIAEYVRQAAERLKGLAEEIESRGAQGLVDEVQYFARQKPGAFLVGAAIAGFGIGRLLRAGALTDDTTGKEFNNGNGNGGRNLRTRPLASGAR